MKPFVIELHQVALNAISKIVLSKTYLVSPSWPNRNARILANLVKEEVISLNDLSEAVHVRLLEIGRQCYEEHAIGQSPNHTVSPQAFAYGLSHKEFSILEIASIKFDGETLEEFVRLYTQELNEKVVKQLLTETVAHPTTSSESTTCDGCC